MKIDPFLVGNIPGNSLTVEPGSVPWEQPPRLTTIEEVAQFYTESLSRPEIIEEILGAVKRGAPIFSLANLFIKMGLMKGVHTIHVGFLVTPIIVEIIKTFADINGVKYVVTNDEKVNKNKISPTAARELVREIREQIKSNPEAQLDEAALENVEEKRGLMAREVQNGI